MFTAAYDLAFRPGEYGLQLIAAYNPVSGTLGVFREKGGLPADPQVLAAVTRQRLEAYLASRTDNHPWLFLGDRWRRCPVCKGRGFCTGRPRHAPRTRECRFCFHGRTLSVSRRTVYEVFRRYAEALKLPYRWPHSLRHSLVTHLSPGAIRSSFDAELAIGA